MRVLFAFLRGFASGLWSVVRDYPWQAALVAALALASWQHGGKRDALAERDQARTALRNEKTARASDRADWRRQVDQARAAKLAAERKSKEIATDAQTTHQALAADNAGLRDYIAANRLRSAGHPAAAARPADDHGASVPDTAATETLVATTEADLRICDADYAYAAAAHEWAKQLIGGGLTAPIGGDR